MIASSPALAAALNAGAFATSDAQFQSLLDDLRRELAPGTVMEVLLVEQMVLAVTRLRRAAAMEPTAGPIDKTWLRFQTMAERSFWKAFTTFEKGRRKANARATAQPATAAIPTPAATAPPAPPQPRPEPKPATATTATPTPAPRRLILRDELESVFPGADLDLAMIPTAARPTINPAPQRMRTAVA